MKLAKYRKKCPSPMGLTQLYLGQLSMSSMVFYWKILPTNLCFKCPTPRSHITGWDMAVTALKSQLSFDIIYSHTNLILSIFFFVLWLYVCWATSILHIIPHVVHSWVLPKNYLRGVLSIALQDKTAYINVALVHIKISVSFSKCNRSKQTYWRKIQTVSLSASFPQTQL